MKITIIHWKINFEVRREDDEEFKMEEVIGWKIKWLEDNRDIKAEVYKKWKEEWEDVVEPFDDDEDDLKDKLKLHNFQIQCDVVYYLSVLSKKNYFWISTSFTNWVVVGIQACYKLKGQDLMFTKVNFFAIHRPSLVTSSVTRYIGLKSMYRISNIYIENKFKTLNNIYDV